MSYEQINLSDLDLNETDEEMADLTVATVKRYFPQLQNQLTDEKIKRLVVAAVDNNAIQLPKSHQIATMTDTQKMQVIESTLQQSIQKPENQAKLRNVIQDELPKEEIQSIAEVAVSPSAFNMDLNPEQLTMMRTYAVGLLQKSRIMEVKSWLGDNPARFRIIFLTGGLLMTFTGLVSLLGILVSPLHAVIEMYICFFGVITTIMESRTNFISERWEVIIKREAKFLSFLRGRGCFYIFVSTLLFGVGGLINYLLAILIGFMGAATFFIDAEKYEASPRQEGHVNLIDEEPVVVSANL